mgnify:CR=1 FL=1
MEKKIDKYMSKNKKDEKKVLTTVKKTDNIYLVRDNEQK